MLSKDKFIELCNQSKLGLDISKLTITEPQPLKVVTENGNNTIVRIKANALSHGFTGSKSFTYTRLDLSRLFYGISTTLDCTKYVTFETALKAIDDVYQLGFEAEDFEVHMPTVETGFVLTPKATNYQYIGSVTFRHAVDLNNISTNTIDGFTYPGTGFNKVDASLLSKRLNGSDSAYIALLNKNEPISYEALSRIFNTVTTYSWSISPEPQDYNLFDIKVKDVFHETYGDGISTTVVFSLSTLLNTNIAGDITIKGIYPTKLPLGITKRFTESSKLLLTFVKGQYLSTEQKDKLNAVLKQKQVEEAASELYSVVYNGTLSELPEHLERHITQDTPRICILKTISTDGNDFIVLHY